MVLDWVPVWVRIYDVPWGKQKRATGMMYGLLLGRPIEVDEPTEEKDMDEFLRVRIELPYDRRLQTQITVGVKGKPSTRKVYKLKYERVPHYCAHCGFMSHRKFECEKRRRGVPSLDYDAYELRCSPYKKFEHRSHFVSAADGSWNEQLLHRWFLPIDVQEILKIRTSNRNEGDFIAWHHEKLGMFTVRSAYRLALEEQLRAAGRQATSAQPLGHSAYWKLIWQCPVPPKVRIFAWKLARNTLATEANMAHRGIRTLSTCTICGNADETTFHAMITCPHARGLWEVMREVWDLPKDEILFENNPDWFMHALKRVDVDQRVAFLMVLWRIWHIHNELTHDKKPTHVEASKRFLMGYVKSLLLIEQNQNIDTDKGKQSIDEVKGFSKKWKLIEDRPHVKQKWKPPDEGGTKLNVDGAFSHDGRDGTGMILRPSDGLVIFAACRRLRVCTDALEAELAAIEEGLALTLAWEAGAFVLETDSAEAIKLIAEGTPNLSQYAMRIKSAPR
ncbi:hypothetical protein ACQ4PT_012903 [Festuca glaucescens]